jgi:hypothetical protein
MLIYCHVLPLVLVLISRHVDAKMVNSASVVHPAQLNVHLKRLVSKLEEESKNKRRQLEIRKLTSDKNETTQQATWPRSNLNTVEIPDMTKANGTDGPTPKNVFTLFGTDLVLVAANDRELCDCEQSVDERIATICTKQMSGKVKSYRHVAPQE